MTIADLVLENGRIATGPDFKPIIASLAIRDGRFSTIGSWGDVMCHKGPGTRVIDLGGRTVIPGLVDAHARAIDGGLRYNLELRCDGLPSLAETLLRLRDQARRTPPSEWLRVVGASTELQFAEGRLPTLEEVNAAAPDTKVVIIHLHGRAMLNGAALRALGYTRESPNPGVGEMKRDEDGHPIGFFLESAQARSDEATLRTARRGDPMNLDAMLIDAIVAKGAKLSREDQVNSSRHFMRELNRLAVTSVIDARCVLQSEPDENEAIEELDEKRQLTLRFSYCHIARRSGHTVHEYRKWSEAVRPGQLAGFTGREPVAPPVASYNPWIALHWLITGKTVCGTVLDPEGAERRVRPRMSRSRALSSFTSESARLVGEDEEKGGIATGGLADLAVLSGDYFAVPEEEIKHIESVLTILGGRVVHASAEFAPLAPSLPPVSPGWCPVASYGGYPSALDHTVAVRSHAGPGVHRASPSRAEPFSRASGWGSTLDCWF